MAETLAPAADEGWSGDRLLQQDLAHKFFEMAVARGATAVDLAGAAETLLVNLIVPAATSKADALEAVDQLVSDLRQTVERCEKFRN